MTRREFLRTLIAPAAVWVGSAYGDRKLLRGVTKNQSRVERVDELAGYHASDQGRELRKLKNWVFQISLEVSWMNALLRDWLDKGVPMPMPQEDEGKKTI